VATSGQKAVAVGAVAGVSIFAGLGIWYMLSKSGTAADISPPGDSTTVEPVQPATPQATTAQFTIPVLDNTTMSPVSGVVVSAGTYTSTTGADGNAIFNLPLGKYKVAISDPRYASFPGPAYPGLVMWIDVTATDLGQSETPGSVTLMSNKPQILQTVDDKSEAVGTYQWFLGCNCCRIMGQPYATVRVQDQNGKLLSGVQVNFKRTMGNTLIDGSKEEDTRVTDSDGRIRVAVKPPKNCGCRHPGSVWTVSNEYPARTGTTEWDVTLASDPSVYLHIATQYSTSISPGYSAPSVDEFWFALG